MGQHNDFGRRGEELAARYLIDRDYSILERNWRDDHREIDIIAEFAGEIVFVEVKTRSSEAIITARDAVDQSKQELIIKAAEAYMREKRLWNPWRYDIITIVGYTPPYQLHHYRYAFRKKSPL